MSVSKDYIIEQLKKQIADFKSEVATEKVGKVMEIGDGIARISGLSNVMASEMVEFSNGAMGVALNLEEDRIGAMILGEYKKIKEGDEVIMPSYTFVSTANAFVLRGAVPVFVDIREDTLNIDERLIEAAITPRTKAICVVHYAGVACEMDPILDIARRHGLREPAQHHRGPR